MRQANLPFHGVTLLTAQHVGDPNLGSNFAEQIGHHSLAAAGLDHMQHRKCEALGRVDEHPSGRDAD